MLPAQQRRTEQYSHLHNSASAHWTLLHIATTVAGSSICVSGSTFFTLGTALDALAQTEKLLLFIAAYSVKALYKPDVLLPFKHGELRWHSKHSEKPNIL